MSTLTETRPGRTGNRLNFFERYLTLWVGLCMVAGIALGRWAASVVSGLRSMELGRGSQVNLPIAILIWLMIVPMMMKVDIASIRRVGERPRGLLVTLFVNWLVKPFSMALFSWFFFRHVFSHWITAGEANQYIAGTIILAAAPCTAMVFVWSHLTDGDPAYTLVQVSLNDLIMLFLFAPIVRFLVAGASSLQVPFRVLLYSVVAFIVIPLAIGSALRLWLIRKYGAGVVREAVAAAAGAAYDQRLAGNSGADLRFSIRQYYRALFSRDPHRRSDPHSGVFQLRPGLQPHASAKSASCRRRSRRTHRG